MFKRMIMFNISGPSGRRYKDVDCVHDMGTPLYEKYGAQLQAEVSYYDQPKYAKYTIYFGISLIFLAMLKHLWYRIHDRLKISSNSSNYFSAFVDVTTSYCRFLGYKQVPPILCTIFGLPANFGSLLFMMASTLYLGLYCFVPHFWYRGCGGFGSPPLAIRAGLMATALTPFIYVLAGKSNAITLLTGISYEKLNSAHQFLGLASLVLSIVHVVPYIYQGLAEYGAASMRVQMTTAFYYMSGIPPLIFLGLLCLLSNKWIRRQCYEGFVSFHWLLGIAYFATLVWHINWGLNAQNYMWGALAFWMSQLGYRALVKTAFRPNALFLRPRIAYLTRSGPEAFLVEIPNSKVSCKPGQHCYLRFFGSRFLDNHPFSVATIPDEETPDMKFLVIPKKGLTRKLHKELVDNVSTRKKVYIDGPYGGSVRDETSFEKVVLVSTGSGISAVLPFLIKLANHVSSCRANGVKFITQKVHFIWIIRYEHDLSWFEQEIFESLRKAEDIIEVNIYVCRKEPDTKSISSKQESDVVRETRQDVIYMRPDIKSVIKAATLLLGKRTMIVSSGSDSMKRTVSRVASSLQARIFNGDVNNQGIEEVYLHTESFGW